MLLAKGDKWIIRHLAFERIGNLRKLRLGDTGHTFRKPLSEVNDRTLVRVRTDAEVLHQAARTDDAEPHAAGRPITAIKNCLKIINSAAVVADADTEHLRRSIRIDHEFRTSLAGVAERIAGDLGNRRRYTGLALAVESQQLGDTQRPLACGYDVVFRLDPDRDNRPSHINGSRFHIPRLTGSTHFATRTVASSRRRPKSR